jgi:hypothetical protein
MRTSTKRGTAVAVLATAAIAVGAPTASAQPIDQQLPAPAAIATAADQPLPAGINAGLGPSSGAAAVSGPQVRAVESPSSGFDWGDAALGAAAALALFGLGAGALVVARRGREARAPATS